MTAKTGENPFRPARREQCMARIALHGPAGSGKTYTALMLATGLAERVAVIDSEHGRALEHRERFVFDHMAPSRFDPRELCTALAKAADWGYGAVVIDSLSHYWMGAGGALEFVDAHENARGGKFSAGWKEFRPIENRMLAALMAYPGHVVVTMRVKTAYVVEANERGKHEPRKVGLKPEQREGIDYEFSIVGELDRDHVLTVTKSTCEELADERIPRPDRTVAETILRWCGTGEPVPTALDIRDSVLLPTATLDELRELRELAKRHRLLGAAVIDEHGDDGTLKDLIDRIGTERKAAAA